jgi:drug/metabolite transporter (DMT)-like permease
LQSSGASLWDSGEWWMLLAAQSMAIGTVMVRWVSKYSDPIAATGWHMILGGIPLLMFAINENSATSLPEMISVLDVKDYLLLLYVSLLGSAASYGVFFYLATVRGSLTQLSSLTFLTPMFAALGGYLVLGETLTPLQLTGALVTILGVTCINAKK